MSSDAHNPRTTPAKRRRQHTQSRDASSSSRAPVRSRIDSWRGSLRHATLVSSPTTAASAVTASATTSAQTNCQPVAGVLSTLPEVRLPDTRRIYPAPILTPEPSVSSPPSPKPMSISSADTRPIPIPDHPPRARRRRRSSISRSSSRSPSPPPHTSPLSSPPTYSAPLPDPPPAFVITQHLEQSHFDSAPSESPMGAINPPLPDESLDSPPPFSSASFPPPDRDGNEHESPGHLSEQTTWWNYVPWSSSTPKGGSGSPNVDSSTLPTSTSPLPPLASAPLTVPQTTVVTTAVGIALLNNIHTAVTDTPTESTDVSSNPNDMNTIDTPDSKPGLNHATTSIHKPGGEGGWYAYVPAWSWGSAGPGSTALAADAAPSGPSGDAPPTASDSAVDGDESSLPDSDSQSRKESPASPSAEVSNPLTDSFQKDTLTWASFLRSSRRLLSVKRVTDGAPDNDKRDENGMEVMDIDFEEEGSGGDDDSKKAEARDGGAGLPVLLVSGGGDVGIKRGMEKDRDDPMAKPVSASPAGSSSSGAAGLASRIWTSSSASTTTAAVNMTNRSPALSRPASRTALDSRQTPPSRHASPAPSKRSISSKSKAPNMVLPKWEETFLSGPRSVRASGRRRRGRGKSVCELPEGENTMLGRGAGGEEGIGGKILGRTVKFVSGLLGGAAGVVDVGQHRGVQGDEGVMSEMERRLGGFGQELPKAWKVLEGGLGVDVLRGCKRVVVIGVHGWFPGAFVRTVIGEPTGTSTKFASMMGSALEEFEKEYGVEFEKVTLVPLEGEGTIEKRVDKLYANLLSNREWVQDLHECDVLFFAAHSQGCVVSTHLLDRLLVDGHVVARAGAKHNQRVCILSLCGIHLGPLRYLSSSTLVGPYLQYFESVAARELFEFQNTESQVSKNYMRALGNVLDHGTKLVYIASLNDQVVPMYSGLFTAASHPLILRALYIDGDAYSSSDFLCNLLTLLIRVLNSGLSDSGLLRHLSEATAGSLNGVGHSTVYEEMGNYTLAVKYLFLADEGGSEGGAKLRVEPFNAVVEQNDYEIPWSLRDLIAHPLTSFLFAAEIEALREAFRAWSPKTTILRELRRKVAPLGRGAGAGGGGGAGAGESMMGGVVSKL